MKRTPLRHKAKKNVRTGLSLLLCLLLAVTLYAAPVLGAEPEEQAPESLTALPSETPPEPLPEEAEAPVPEVPAPEDGEPETAEERELLPETDTEAEKAEAREGEQETVTLTFQMGPFGTKTLEVAKGQYPSEVPEIPALPAAAVQGWYDQAGNPVYPDSQPAESDAVYTARWSRQVRELLNTDSHFSYIDGYSSGAFKPENSVTRAEAAKMFYSLLRNEPQETKSFPDAQDNWYTDAVEAMAGLGILQGYENGNFKPSRPITRAEFVKIAVSCDTLMESGPSFSDVSKTSWAAPYIATAAEKGWVAGFSDGTFRPNSKITRAQAVTILNRMLGRSPDPEIDKKEGVKNFYDVYPDAWYYGAVAEASTTHYYYPSGGSEIWSGYEWDYTPPKESGWVTEGSSQYYLDGETQKFLRGEHTIDGVKYLFDNATCVSLAGFRMEGGWRRYYKNGKRLDDISGLNVVSGPYFIKVYKNSNYLIVFARDGSGKYNIPVRAMRTSCGEATITGTYYTPSKYRWLQMIGDTWAQWCTQIEGNYLLHSVPNWTQNNADLEVDEYNHLGETRSLGCIRLNCRDAKWIFDNCALGTEVFITTAESSGPLPKPAGIQIPSWHTWDPTDPTAYWRCQQNGCH